jgi:copper/silver efflux system protein
MIEAIIRWSVKARGLVVVAALVLTVIGFGAIRSTPVDALPDLSDVQVIIRTTYPGQAPQIVENQVTYPLTTTMLSVPGARVVRGYSFVGDSFVYVLFDDGTDLYWARSRVLEYLSQVQGRLPAGATASLGPDATGVGWIYEYALVDKTGRHDLAQLRSIQDWFLRYELKAVPGVAEVASIGGMVKQYQVVVDPQRLAAYGVTAGDVSDALKRANQETGGAVVEMAEAEYVVRATGYLKTLDDFRAVPVGRRRSRQHWRCCHGAARPGHATRDCRTQRRGRSRRRCDRHAPGQERPRGDRGRPHQAGRAESRSAQGRRDCNHL